MKTHIEFELKDKTKVSIPKTWKDLSYNKYNKIMSKQNDLTNIDLVSIILDLDANSMNHEDFLVCLFACQELLKSPLNIKQEKVEYNGVDIDLNKIYSELTVLQFETMSDIIKDFTKEGNELKLFCVAFEKILADRYKDKDNDYIIQQVEEYSCEIVLTITTFFLKRHLQLLSGITPSYSQVKAISMKSKRTLLVRWKILLVRFIGYFNSVKVRLLNTK